MANRFSDTSPLGVTPVDDPPAAPLTDGVVAPPAPDAPGAPGASRRFANDRLNGRVGGAVDVAPLALRWRVELDEELRPEYVAAVGDRVVVRGALRWWLFDAAGAALGGRATGGLDVTLGRTHGLVFAAIGGGVEASSLRDARRVLSFSGFLGAAIDRRQVFERDGVVTTVGVSRPLNADDAVAPAECVVQARDLGAQVRLDDEGDPMLREVRTLSGDTRRLLGAMDADGLVLAADDALYRAAPDLTLQSRIEGTGAPLAMSLDDAGRVYLIHRTPEGPALWVLTREGVRVAALPLGAPARATGFVPPTVAHDHTAYVALHDRVVAVHPTGVTLGAYPVAHFAGAAVDAADTLLVSDGARLVAFRGEARTVLFSFGDERLRGAPVVTATGEVYCVTDGALYCLGPHS
jgi:hypothetical protein